MKSLSNLFVCLTLLFLSGGLPAQTFKIATLAPENSEQMEQLRAAGAEISHRTGERVRFKYYGGGVQGADEVVIRKIRVGQLHGFITTAGGLDDLHPDAGLYSLPMLLRDIDEANHVRRRLDPLIREKLEQAGWINFGFAYSGFARLMSTRPIDSLEALKSRKIWVPSGSRTGFNAIRTLGGAPVQMPITDVLTGLQTELIDSVVTSALGAVIFQWNSQVSYVTELPIAYLYSAMVIQDRFFQRLSPQDQTIVREVMEALHHRIDRESVASDEAYLSALAEDGIEILHVDPVQAESWQLRVNRSNHGLAREGLFSEGLLDTLEGELQSFRDLRGSHTVAESSPSS